MMNRATRTTGLRQLLAAGAASLLVALPGWAKDIAGSRTAGAASDTATIAAEVAARDAAEVAARDAARDALIADNAAAPRPQDAMRKVGEARLKVLLWSVYDSRLYTPSGSYRDGDRPLRLEIQYLRDIEAQALVDRTLVEWEAMGRSHPNQERWLEQLATLWPDIRSNDVLALELDRDSIATFRHNGEVLGRIEDPAFGQQFVDIWLSRDCTRPELRLALLGRDSGD